MAGTTHTTRRSVLNASLRVSGALPTFGADRTCYADATGWRVLDATGATVAVTQGAGGTFEATPFIPSDTARYGAWIDANAEIPTLDAGSDAANALAAIWTGDFTFITLAEIGQNGASHALFSQENFNTSGLVIYENSNNISMRISNSAGAPTSVGATVAGSLGGFQIITATCSGTTYRLRTNGTNGAPTVYAPKIKAPTGIRANFGGHQGGSPINGRLTIQLLFARRLTDAEIADIERSLAGFAEESRTLSVTRATIANWEAPDGLVYTMSAGLPRVDARGMLIEAARTNLVFYSSELTTGWTGDTAAAGTLVAAPDLSITARTITAVDGAGQHRLYRTFATVLGSTYTRSFYAKAGTVSWIGIRNAGFANTATFNLATGALGPTTGVGTSSKIMALANGWYRCTMTCPSVAIGEYTDIAMGNSSAAAAGAGFVAASSYLYLWNVQAELCSYATSPIATLGVAVQRPADIVTISTAGWPVAAGKIEIDYTPEAHTGVLGSSFYVLNAQAGGIYGNTGFALVWSDTGSGSIQFICGNALGNTPISSGPTTWTRGTTYHLELIWGQGNMWMYRTVAGVRALLCSNLTGTARMPGALPNTCDLSGTDGWISNFRVSR